MPADGQDGALHIAVEQAPDPADLAFLEERLAAAAIAAVGAGEDREFGVFVRDGEGRIVGGVAASTWGGCCQVHAVWVDDELRGRHLGRALMAEAEAEARRRGCAVLMGLTYDVLTAGYYEEVGFVTIGVLEGYPSGTATRWLRKDL